MDFRIQSYIKAAVWYVSVTNDVGCCHALRTLLQVNTRPDMILDVAQKVSQQHQNPSNI